ncbi:MAG: hypothetical protein KBF64_01465 [Anaerolineaceae bacterium]|nr:hypothetical protein [Anaerolineaceae bacterium]
METNTNCQLGQLNQKSNPLAFEVNHPHRFILFILSKVWNRGIKPFRAWLFRLFQLKKINRKQLSTSQWVGSNPVEFQPGDVVRVRTREEIEPMLDADRKFRGCTFLDCMWAYCGTTQKVFKPLHRFLDERDFVFKKVKGVVILEGVFCDGLLVFGQCDRSCFLFWREEWLEKLSS